eukprot:754665-Pyramimonas_sp.AAC.1
MRCVPQAPAAPPPLLAPSARGRGSPGPAIVVFSRFSEARSWGRAPLRRRGLLRSTFSPGR